MISSTADQAWPSTTMAHSVAERLRHADFAFKVVEIDYPEGDHFSYGVTPTEASAKVDTAFGGGNPVALSKARKETFWGSLLRRSRPHARSGTVQESKLFLPSDFEARLVSSDCDVSRSEVAPSSVPRRRTPGNRQTGCTAARARCG